MSIHSEAIPIFPETRALCKHYGLDPLGLIASGALLIFVGAAESRMVLRSLETAGVVASIIGHVVRRSEGTKMTTAAGFRALPIYEQDELTRI